MPHIILTGGSGKAGRACIRDLQSHGYSVLNVDQNAPTEHLCGFIKTDLTDFGQTLDALSGGDSGPHDVFGIVHLAAIPAPRMLPNAVTFQNNTVSTYNVFEAARRLGIKNIVWASSETVLGLPFETPPPFVPVDESVTRPESAYSLSKLLGEEMAKQFCRWDPDFKIIGLRFSNIIDPKDYSNFQNFQDDARKRKWNLWGYVDARDAAQAVRKSLEVDLKGAEVFIIANSDTVMNASNEDLMSKTFPGIPIPEGLGNHETLLSIQKARQILGFEPEHTWRQ